MKAVKGFYEKHKLPVILVCIAVLALLPFAIHSSYMMGVLCRIIFYSIMAGALNVINGYSGQMCIGFAGFFAVGAYTEAILSTKCGVNFWFLLLLGGIITAVIGGIIALPTLKLQGVYLAIITLGFSEVVRLIALNWSSLTGGTMGIKGIAAPELFGIVINKPHYYYYIFLVLAILFLVVTGRVLKSKTGRAWMSIREDSLAARSLGVQLRHYKISSFMYGAFWAGVAGAAYAGYSRYIDSTYFTLDEGFNILSMVIIGGQGTLAGPFLGALVVTFLTEALRSFSQWRMVAYAVLIVAMMWLRPQGLVGASDSVLAGKTIGKKRKRVRVKEVG